LGISADAVRSRIKRGTLTTEREGGRVFVVLAGTDRAQPTNRATATDHPTEGYTPGPQEDRTAELIATLREQLAAERQAHAEARQIIMQQSVTMRQLSASESPEEPVEAEADPGRVGDRDHATSPETGAHRPWWRRVFGG